MVTIEIAAVHPRMGSAELPWPARKSEQAAGWDCVAAIDESLVLWPGRLVKVPLGFALALPGGWEAQVRPRSGLAAKGIIMPNSPGTVDADYRGEVSALLFLLDQEEASEAPALRFPLKAPGGSKELTLANGGLTKASDRRFITISPGDRICQLVIAPVPDVTWRHISRAELSPTSRGEGGFGSTGR